MRIAVHRVGCQHKGMVPCITDDGLHRCKGGIRSQLHQLANRMNNGITATYPMYTVRCFVFTLSSALNRIEATTIWHVMDPFGCCPFSALQGSVAGGVVLRFVIIIACFSECIKTEQLRELTSDVCKPCKMQDCQKGRTPRP